MNRPPSSDPVQTRRIRRTGVLCAGLVAGMVGLAYAAVPFYNLFCQATGFDGTPLVGSKAPERVLDRTLTVRLDANVAPGLNWRFTPETPEITAKVGETKTVFFKVRNAGPTPTAGVATYNVQPGQIGAYFVKLECFCFSEQTLHPGENVEFPVVFYIDPAIEKEADLKTLSSITLSYTYFASKNGQPVATTSAPAAQPKS